MLGVLQQQYDWVKSARQDMLAFLEELPTRILHQPVPEYGHGKIIRTHLHVVDCYRYWLESFALRRLNEHWDVVVHETADMKFVRQRFAEVDDLVQRFLQESDDRWSDPIVQDESWQGYPKEPTPLLLFTHAVTHEFHHRGQLVTMARQLGYPPPADNRLGGLFI